jgi:DivIVA domain-containing protein
MTDSTSGLRNLDAVTGADLQTVTIATSKGFGRGYDQHEVDSFVVRCAQLVDRLRARMAEVSAGYEAQVAELSERIDRDSRSNEVAQAMSVLITAQQTADKTVAQADEYSAKVMAEARELYEDTRKNAATLEQETEDKARHVYEEALSRSEAIEREAAERVERMNLNSEAVQAELDQQTAYLRTLRDTSRIQIQTFLEGLLDHVAEEYGRAHPIAAEAATATASNARKAKRTGRGKPAVKGAPGKSTIKVAGLTPVRRGPSTGALPPQAGSYQDAYEELDAGPVDAYGDR